MIERPSGNLIDQRVRNRILDCLDYLADGDSVVKKLGFGDYLEVFFDFLPYSGSPELPKSMSADECEATLNVLTIMREALEDTPSEMSDDEFISTGWPARIRPVAGEAVGVFMKRGRSDEDVEEQESNNANTILKA